jgi:hypothetical protein
LENKLEKGLPQIGNAYFMWRSTTGTTHAINPKTKKTFCNLTVLESWEPTDQLPDSKHEPSCSRCRTHYDDEINEQFCQIKKDLEESIDTFLTVQVWTKDADGSLGRFVKVVNRFMAKERKLAEKKHPEAAKQVAAMTSVQSPKKVKE